MPTSRPASPSPLLLRALAVLTSGSLALALFCAWGWYRARQERISIDALSPEDRQALTEEMLTASPGAFVPALFEPAVGYTLKPGQRITEWDSEVAANEIGYRTGRLGRGGREGFRVVFLGDSWTFGMGISEEESFPRQFEALANRLGAARGRVVAFNLGLPGYNVGNEVAALEFFYDRLRPDAVVLCPTPNDAESTANVLPNGSLTRAGVERDRYGDPSLVFPLRGADSFRLRSRWRRTFDEVRRLEERLEKRGVPLLVYFTATWDEPLAHELMRGSGLKAPYLITPPKLTEGRFRNPAPWRHGTAEANRLYAHMVYRGLAERLGWPPPPPAEEKRAEAPLYRRPPAEGPELRELRERESRRIPERYEPGLAAQVQCVGAMNCATGLMGKSTMIWVRRRPGATRLAVTLHRLEQTPSLYPLPVEISIPSPSGGTRKSVVLPATGPETHRFLLDLPADLPPGAVLDVTLRAERVVSAPRLLAPRSLFVAGLEQE